MKNLKKIFFAVIAMGFISQLNGQAKPNFELVNVSHYGVDITGYLSNLHPYLHPYDNQILDFGTIDSGGGKYTGTIPLNKTTMITIFSGYNPTGQDYHFNIDPKKTKTIFLEWDHFGSSPRLKPQSVKKSFFSKDTNIKASEIIRMNKPIKKAKSKN